MDAEELEDRTRQFAHRCVKLSLGLPENHVGIHVRKQLIRCATSVASNYRATCLAQSRAAFVLKLSIVLEEADESIFWMEFLVEEHLLEEQLVSPLLTEARELTAKNRAGEFKSNNNQ